MASEIMRTRFAEIERLALAAGLTPYDVVFQEAPTSTICEVASYGLPTRYSHWSHGRSLQYQKSQQEMGSSKIYELILNSNPSLAFLDSTNTDTANLMICAHCYGPGTYVQTEYGLKPIEAVKPGERVFNYRGELVSVFAPTSRSYDGDMVTIQAGSYKFSQTSDHQLYVVKTQPSERTKYRSWSKAFDNIDYEPKWCAAGTISVGDFLVVKKPDIGKGTLTNVEIVIDKVRYRQHINKKVSVNLDADFGLLIGLYLAEGYTEPTGQIGFCFHEDETKLHELTVRLLDKYFALKGAYSVNTKTRSTVIRCSEICIASFLRDTFGHSCYNKHIPDEWIQNTSVDFLQNVLVGFLLGDGNKTSPRNVGFSTTSSRLAMQIQHIALRLGIFIGLSHRDRTTEEQNRSICFEGHASGIHDQMIRKLLGLELRECSREWSGVIEKNGWFYVKINAISNEQYNGNVYCLNVPDGSSFTLANGIITHNCLGHSHVFKNNIMFKMNNEPNMVQTAKQHADRIDDYRKDYGDDEVDDWIDIAHSLAHNIDAFKGYNRKKYDHRHIKYEERKATDWEDIVHQNRKPLINKKLKNVHIPPAPEKDILWFLTQYSNLEPWQKDVFEIVRRESYYFYAQVRTKILNEGAASYWHLELMNQYFLGNKNDYGVTDIQYPLTEEEHVDFLTLHEKVVRPGIKQQLKIDVPEYVNHQPTGKYTKIWNKNIIGHPGMVGAIIRINPYYVGFRLLRDIKERWDEYYKKGFMVDDLDREIPVTINGTQKIFQVIEEEDDVSLLRNYLTEELVDDLHLFTYGNEEEYDDNYEYQEEMRKSPSKQKNSQSLSEQEVINKTVRVKSKQLEDIIHAFERSKSNYGVPSIVVRRVDKTGLLRLEHLVNDKPNLDIKYAEEVIKYIYKVWNRPVELIRKSGDRTWQMYFDGDAFQIDYQSSDYPESVEKEDGPSSW